MFTIAGGILLAVFLVLMLIGIVTWVRKGARFIGANAMPLFVIAFALVYGYALYEWTH